MADSVVRARIDPALKKSASAVLEEDRADYVGRRSADDGAHHGREEATVRSVGAPTRTIAAMKEARGG